MFHALCAAPVEERQVVAADQWQTSQANHKALARYIETADSSALTALGGSVGRSWEAPGTTRGLDKRAARLFPTLQQIRDLPQGEALHLKFSQH
jgi:hypothetical protein